MKISNLSLLLYLVGFEAVDGTSPTDVEDHLQDLSKRSNDQIIKSDQYSQANDIGFEHPCPNAEDIVPCLCTYDDTFNAMDLDCSDVESKEQLKKVFGSDFPSKNFSEFRIIDNAHLKVLESSVFSDVRFESIDIRNNAIEIVETDALDSSYKTATSLRFDYNKITSFPFDDIHKFLNLSDFDISGNTLTIPADIFNGLSNLKKISVAGNHGKFAGNFQFIPNLVELDLHRNDYFSAIPAYFFKTGSYNLVSIDLHNCQIESVEPDAFDHLKDLRISLASNLLTTLEEATWRPLLEAGVMIDLFNNPLDCGCDLAWLFGEDQLMDQVSYDTTCNDGEYIHNLDPTIFDQC